jgi:DNA mismatch repair protein MutL
MPSIRILTDQVANQIAAGEVIERPVAVVKELVENSIDAGATKIEVEFRNGGKSYIRIEDNGVGMAPDDALLSLERHATSKLKAASDLDEVLSFGFRGEALPSIASVSKFRLRTRHAESEHGTEININGGKLLDKRDCGMPVGSVIEVSNLFNSVPARRKFLKTDATESAHITYTCRLFAVAHPHIAFRVLENGRTVFQSPACETLSDRIAEIWGRQLAKDLIPVDAEDSVNGYRLTGLTAKPGIGRSTRRELITMVNSRPVDSRTLGFAVLDAYHGQIQKGRYPPAFLFLDIAPKDIDINVHPAKREIRFRQEGAVRRFVLNAISETLASAQKKIHPSNQTETLDNSKVTRSALLSASPAPSSLGSPRPATHANSLGEANPKPRPSAPSPSPIPGPSPETTGTESAPTEQKPHCNWRFIASFQKRYALFEAEKGLVLLNLRHADQRVRFEQIINQTNLDKTHSQQLLIPMPLELDTLSQQIFEGQRKQLSNNGFRIEAFGRSLYRIEAIPAWITEDKAEDFIRELIDQVRQRGTQRKTSSMTWESVARLAVTESYQTNDPLNNAQIETLAQNLLKCQNPHTAPTGKPTFQEISWREWARRFGSE